VTIPSGREKLVSYSYDPSRRDFTHTFLLVISLSEYVRYIVAHATRSLTSSSLPVTNYIGFAEWLHHVSKYNLQDAIQPHVRAVLYDLCDDCNAMVTSSFKNEKPPDLSPLPKSHQGHIRVWFLLDFLPASCGTAIRINFKPDLEFFLAVLSLGTMDFDV
jgi:hypothetical protein